MELAMHGFARHVRECVVHPAHVPLHAETQPAGGRRTRHHRPCGRLLGDHLGVRVIAIHRFVQLAQKLHSTEVLPSSVHIRDPLPLPATVVQVKHRSDCVDAQSIDVVAVQPKQPARKQERAHFVPVVVEDRAAPLGMKPLARIGMLVEKRAVEHGQAVRVGREMRRHPVEDHTDAMLMQEVDQIHQVLRRSIARGRCEVAGCLVAPGAVERVLGQRQQLDMGESLLDDVLRERARDVPISWECVVLGAPPRSEVHFVDRHRRSETVAACALCHPGAVAPLVLQGPCT